MAIALFAETQTYVNMSRFKIQIQQGVNKRLHRPWFGGSIGALITSLFGLMLLYLPVGDGLQNWSYDLPFLLRSERPISDIVILYLDEETYASFKEAPSDFDRANFAKLVRQLKAEGAKMIAFDVFFSDPKKSQAASDRQFAAAMHEHDNVVLAAQPQMRMTGARRQSLRWMSFGTPAKAGDWG